jgi:hypothetical protein
MWHRDEISSASATKHVTLCAPSRCRHGVGDVHQKRHANSDGLNVFVSN